MNVDLGSFVSRVDGLLRECLAEQSARWASTGLVEPALTAITELVSHGGKRVRPCFVALGWAAAEGQPESDVPVKLGASVEMLHVSALLHDDVVDRSVSRRGAPTAHVAAAARHRREDLAGDPVAFGEGLAILAGDLAVAIADSMVAEAGPATRMQWNRMKTEVAVGQVLDHVATARGVRDPGAALEVVRLKTSQYTVVRPLLVGATEVSGSPTPDLVDALTAYGLAVGEAFQLRDDILGVFGDGDATGKPVGADLREAKPTLLLAFAHERATGDQRRVLDRVGAVDLTAGEISAIGGVLRDTGALDAVEARIAERTAKSQEILVRSGIDRHVQGALADLAETLMSRTS